ncbi:MAG TPA: radical SAM protein [Verrucomicrobiae bacterium]|nr:radical SAM protein [Verrucomicrobiae bacterium]
MQLVNQHDVFAIPHRDGYLVYAPLAGRVVYANANCVAQLRGYLETGERDAVDPQIRTRLGGLDWLNVDRRPEPLPSQRPFRPTFVTLFLTNRCNLRCTYCYARAGEFDGCTMPTDVWQAAIDFVVGNACEVRRPVGVGFHGGGEPTLAWDALTSAVEYAREAVAREKVNGLTFGLATNGVMSNDRAEYVARTFRTVTLSLDGDADLQNRQRPRLCGGGSFDAVMAFVEVLRRHGTAFVIRCTVTENNVSRLAELVDFYVDRTGCKLLHFEPVFLSGRCRNIPSAVPLPKLFADNFVAALDRAVARGARVRFSAARVMGAFASFCGCSQDPFNVTHEGDVTACFEVCHAADPLAKTYHFGRFDCETGHFAFDQERLAHLRSLTVHNKPLCARCFAKWNCAGDCPVKGLQPYAAVDGESPRCRMIQSITRAMLERALEPGTCRVF